MCLLLLMSHDFPAFTTLQKAVRLGKSKREVSVCSSVWWHMWSESVRQLEKSSQKETILSRLEEFLIFAKQDYYICLNTTLKLKNSFDLD